MNIFEEVKRSNLENQNKIARTIRMDNGELRTLTYKQLFDKVEQYAASMVASGVRKGDRIAIVAENSPEWDVTYLAITKIYCTAVLIDASLPKEDIEKLIDKSDVRTIFTSVKVMEKLGECKSSFIPVVNIADGNVFEGSSAIVSPCMEFTTDANPEIANIIYSSGTTKTASGIMHSHEAMIESTRNCIASNGLKKEDRCLSIIPNSHIYGMVCLVLGPLLLGADVYYIETIAGDKVLKAFADYKPTILPAVPKVYDLFRTQIMKKIDSDKKTKKLFHTVFPICLKARRNLGWNLGKRIFKSIHQGFGGELDILCSAGAPMSVETAEFYYGVGFNLLLTYGATETNIPTIGNRQKNITTDSCGTPYDNVQISFSKEGEILIKSPYMMKGYFRDEAATNEAFDEAGWFKSGDMGTIDEKGNIRIVGRCKENIVLATGKKVAPDDIEAGYHDIQGIKEIVVCGVPAERGEYDESHAFVIVENLKADLQGIRSKIMERSASLSSNMKLAKVHFVEEIAKTSLQKPKRYLLKQLVVGARGKEQEKVAVSKETSQLSFEEQVIKLVATVAETDIQNITQDTKLFGELGMDSLSAITLGLEIETQFKVNIDQQFHKELDIKELIQCIKQGEVEQKEDDKVYPLPKTRVDYLIFTAIRHLARVVFNMKVVNESVIPQDSGYIICANHVSNFDYLYVTIHITKDRFNKFGCMAKKELFNGSNTSKRLAKVCGMVPVDRSGTNIKTMNALKNCLNHRWGILIHPEGTRSHDGKLGKLKQGAAALAIEADVPIVPAYIKGGYEIYKRGTKMPNLFNWKKFRRYKVEVHYGQPIDPINMTAEQLTAKVAQEIENLSIS